MKYRNILTGATGTLRRIEATRAQVLVEGKREWIPLPDFNASWRKIGEVERVSAPQEWADLPPWCGKSACPEVRDEA